MLITIITDKDPVKGYQYEILYMCQIYLEPRDFRHHITFVKVLELLKINV